MSQIDFNEIFIFINVVKEGSFTKAALKLKMPISTVSARVSSLEARLAVTLLQRTTRKLNLTPAGELYYEQCLKGIDEIKNAEKEIDSHFDEPKGIVRLTAPVYLGHILLPPIVSELSKSYPKMQFEILLSDDSLDLVSGGIDLAIRAGDLRDSSLMTMKICEMEFSLFASREYLKRYGEPSHPKELSEHRCLIFTPFKSKQQGPEWSFKKAGKKTLVRVLSHVEADDLNMIKSLALSGSGIALLPKDKSEKVLIEVLSDWRGLTKPIQFLYPAQKYPSLKMKALLEVAKRVVTQQISPL